MPDNETLYGIVARHRGDWWFVSSKDIDERPTCVYRLAESPQRHLLPPVWLNC